MSGHHQLPLHVQTDDPSAQPFHDVMMDVPPTFSESLKVKLSSPNISALDGLRAIAVFLVIIYHFGFEKVPAGLGVLAFFVLSGFLITWLLLKENEKTGHISIRSFYTRRVLRIFPAFYVFWVGTVIMLLLTHRPIPWAHAVSAFFYLGDYYNAIMRPPASFVSHTWSLAIEEQFYLLWPLVLRTYRQDLSRLTSFLLCVIGCGWVYRIALSVVFHVNQSYIYNAFDTRLDHLMIGCLLAVMLKRGLLASFWQLVCSRLWLPAVTLGLLCISVYADLSIGVFYRDVIGFALDPLLVAILMIQLIWFSSSLTWCWIDWSWMRYLGRISYSLYLYQQIALHPVRRILSSQPIILQLIVAILVVLIVASASFHLIERPFLKLKGKLELSSVSVHKKVASAQLETSRRALGSDRQGMTI